VIVARSLRPAWEQVRDATITILAGISFADLAQAARSESEPRRTSKSQRP
jgi:DNA-binding IscR family transcriptional regulator